MVLPHETDSISVHLQISAAYLNPESTDSDGLQLRQRMGETLRWTTLKVYWSDPSIFLIV